MIYLFFSFSLRISSFPSTSSKGYTFFTDLLMTLLVLPIIILTPLVLSSCPFISSTTRPRIHLFQDCFSSSAIIILFIDDFISFGFFWFFLYFYHIHVIAPRIHFAIVTKNDLTTCWYDEHVWVKLNLFQHCPESNYYRLIICTQIASNEGSKSLNRYHKQIHVVLSSIRGQFHTTILKHRAVSKSFLHWSFYSQK